MHKIQSAKKRGWKFGGVRGFKMFMCVYTSIVIMNVLISFALCIFPCLPKFSLREKPNPMRTCSGGKEPKYGNNTEQQHNEYWKEFGSWSILVTLIIRPDTENLIATR